MSLVLSLTLSIVGIVTTTNFVRLESSRRIRSDFARRWKFSIDARASSTVGAGVVLDVEDPDPPPPPPANIFIAFARPPSLVLNESMVLRNPSRN